MLQLQTPGAAQEGADIRRMGIGFDGGGYGAAPPKHPKANNKQRERERIGSQLSHIIRYGLAEQKNGSECCIVKGDAVNLDIKVWSGTEFRLMEITVDHSFGVRLICGVSIHVSQIGTQHDAVFGEC